MLDGVRLSYGTPVLKRESHFRVMSYVSQSDEYSFYKYTKTNEKWFKLG